MDFISATVRSRVMSRIRSQNTGPELLVRSCLHANGLRYKLHDRKLPGTPDIVFPSRRACVFVHGCFWHGCKRCKDGTRVIGSNRSYWVPKIERNRRRDRLSSKELKHLGWQVLVIWECETTNRKRIRGLVDTIKRIKPGTLRRTER
jgi:DNA mismatch endonuclease, patch repair protein